MSDTEQPPEPLRATLNDTTIASSTKTLAERWAEVDREADRGLSDAILSGLQRAMAQTSVSPDCDHLTSAEIAQLQSAKREQSAHGKMAFGYLRPSAESPEE